MWLHEMKAQIYSLFRRFLQVRRPLSPGKKRGFTAHFEPDGLCRRLALSRAVFLRDDMQKIKYNFML